MLKILAIGDLTEPRSALFLREKLSSFKRKNGIDFVIANGENAGFIMGPTPETAALVFDAGVDCLTGGNHTMQNKLLFRTLENDTRLLRPANYPAAAPGFGYRIFSVNGYRVLVMNLLGRVHIEPVLDSPFTAAEAILRRESGKYDLAVLDIHAEATGEKLAVAHNYDGKINVIFGTHTHVATADEQILPCGSGYITDIGMTGPINSIIGSNVELVIERMRTKITSRFTVADGEVKAHGALFEFDTDAKNVTNVKRIVF